MHEPQNLKHVFELIESSVIAIGDSKQRKQPMAGALRDAAAEAHSHRSDNDYFRAMVRVVFYSGMSAALVTARIKTIEGHFADYAAVADYGEPQIARILADPEMVKNDSKIRACVYNARQFAAIVKTYSSFPAYLDSMGGRGSIPAGSAAAVEGPTRAIQVLG